MRRGLAQSHRATEPDRLEGILVASLGEWALMSCAQTDRRHTLYSLAPHVSLTHSSPFHRSVSLWLCARLPDLDPTLPHLPTGGPHDA